MEKIRILFDLDGLAANWSDRMIDKYFPDKGINWLNKLPQPERHVVIGNVYKEEPNFFANLEPFTDIYRLISMAIQLVGEENVGWLSACGPDHHCFETVKADKLEWIKKHVDEKMGIETASRAIIVPLSEDKIKEFDSLENLILIDDYAKNCTAWFEAGGSAIVHASGETPVISTLSSLEYMVEELENNQRCFWGKK